MAKKEKPHNILVRNVPKDLWDYIVDQHSASIKKDQRKSIASFALDMMIKGFKASKK